MPLTPWAPPSSASPTMAASSSVPILEPALVFMLRIGHPIRSLSSLIMSTCAVPDRLQILKFYQIMSVIFSISTRYSRDSLQQSRLLQTLSGCFAYNNKNMLQTGLIIGGWDKYKGGKIYGVPLGGTILEQPFAIGGSGSTYLYGFFDQEWKEGMTKEEAERLVLKAVSLAIARDGASGGVVRTVIINSEGVTRNYYPGDTLPLWHEELEPQNSLLDILSSSGPDMMVT
ncbi:hypothetical protein L3X38_001289 [Prunus dulcis]|uniref:Proteasome endopeptidase complex n=1 Tax=Prunus dulcis TaxID=3755 RepID=A0AAD4WTS9_PRUDU|nr:hypothetical protein L3X38_001289 [Prunus dulcis]